MSQSAQFLLHPGHLLGAGAMGQVYWAKDNEGKEYAVKVLKNPSPSFLSLFEGEVSILSKLKHRGLVEIAGFSKSGEALEISPSSPCFWMEYVEGKPLLEAAREASPSQILAWLQECLDALEYLHSQGIVHGDLKPANLMVQREGSVKLLDFGLASFASGGEAKASGLVKGTIPYLAPETLEGKRLPASDLFSLGTIFYQLLAGEHPRAHAKGLADFFRPPAVNLSDRALKIPPLAARVIDRMIEADLGDRLQSARDAKEALGGGEVQNPSDIAAHSFELFGRDEERSRFLKFLKETAAAGGAGIVLVHGLKGTGKTRFARELFFETSLRGHGTRQGLVAPEEPLLRHLLHKEGDLKEGGEGFTSVSFLSSAEHLRPHHFKELYLFLKKPPPAPTLLVLEYDDEALDQTSEAFFAGLKQDPAVLDLSLKNLRPGDAERMIQTLLKNEAPPPWVREIFERTQGNPGFLAETCHEILSAGLIQKKHRTSSQIRNLDLPDDLSHLLEKRWNRLSLPDRELFAWAASSAQGAGLEDITSLSKKSRAEIRSWLMKMTDLGLLRRGEGTERYRPAHPRAVTWTADAMTSTQKAEIHRKWLELTESDPIARAVHALEIPGHPKKFEWVLQAAQVLFSRQDYPAALELLEKALEAHPEREEKENLLRTTANAYGRLGKFEENQAWLQKWFSEYPEGPHRINPVKFYLATGVVKQNLGDLEEARRRLKEALKAGDSENAEHRPFLVKALSVLARIEIDRGQVSEAEDLLRKADDLSSGNNELKTEILKHQALLSLKQNRWDLGLLALNRAQEIHRDLKDHRGLFSILLEKGNLALEAGRPNEAEISYAQALEVASKAHDEASLARAYQNMGVLACREGDYAAALTALEKARELFVFFGAPFDRALNLLQLAWANASVGRLTKGRDLLAQAERQSERSSGYVKRKEEVEEQLEILEKGTSSRPPSSASLKEEKEKSTLEERLNRLNRERDPSRADEAREILFLIREKLPAPLKITFEERADYKYWVLNQSMSAQKGKEMDDMDVLQKLNAITKELLSSDRIDQVLIRLMDAAMELSKADRGFLVVKSENPAASLDGSPLPGFEVKVSRNVARERIEDQDFAVSLSAVREAMKTGSPLVTDNALQDARFEAAESVHELELKSILALPLKGTEGVIGALYLDHRYETNIFRGADLNLMQMFADQAALALQKARMIEQLKRSNERLSSTVETQAGELSVLKREVEDSRLKLAHEYKDIIGQAPAMLEMLSLVDRVTDTAVPVWIYGESGTGKEMVARALHFNSARAKKPFVSENCSALPETLLESELFGHKKGAFTHADRDKKGLLEHANGGTVFLDEIADMSGPMQAKLLRFLQEGEIRPVGSNEIVKVDVRVVSASNKDLHDLIEQEKFREDLFYRLNGVTVTLPPLRERLEDLPLLAQHFLKKFAQAEKKEALEITPEAFEILMEYSWPGNVRELENTLRTAVLFHQKGKLIPKSFQFKKTLFGEAPRRSSRSSAVGANLVFAHRGSHGGRTQGSPLQGMSDEKHLLLKALHDHGYHKGLAAEALGISRRYLYTQMMRHGVPIHRVEMKAYVEDHLGLKR